MINETNFVVRVSGRRENSCYIDYLGAYKVNDIAKIIGAEPPVIKEKYITNGAVYDEDLDVYYFTSPEGANKAIADILKDAKADSRGRLIFLTEAEVEYIRKALINEGVNTIHLKNRIKDAIFRKLNG